VDPAARRPADMVEFKYRRMKTAGIAVSRIMRDVSGILLYSKFQKQIGIEKVNV
jgi:hypothetical protein